MPGALAQPPRSISQADSWPIPNPVNKPAPMRRLGFTSFSFTSRFHLRFGPSNLLLPQVSRRKILVSV